MLRFLLALVTLGVALSAHADYPMHAPEEDSTLLNLDAGYQFEQDRDKQNPAAGFGVGMTIDLNDYFFIGTSYSDLRTDEFQDQQTGTTGRLQYRRIGAQLGAGFSPLPHTSITATYGYTNSSTRGLDAFSTDQVDRSHSSSGSLSLGYRVLPAVELSAGRAYSYVGSEPGWENQAGIGLRLFHGLWLDGTGWRGGSKEGWTVGLRTDFPRGD